MFEDITGVIRHGGALPSDHGALEPENPMWVEFARSMAPMMANAGGTDRESVRRVEADQSVSISRPVTDCTESLSPSTTRTRRWSAWTGRMCWKWRKRTPPRPVSRIVTRPSPEALLMWIFGAGYDIVLIPNFLAPLRSSYQREVATEGACRARAGRHGRHARLHSERRSHISAT